MAIKAFCMAKK